MVDWYVLIQFLVRLLIQVTVSSLRLNNVPVCIASAGQTVTFKLSEGPPVTTAASGSASLFAENEKGIAILSNSGRWQPAGRKRSSAAGLVLLGNATSSTTNITTNTVTSTAGPQAHWEFEAELLVLNHPSKIRANYEPVVHVGCVKQAAKLVSVRKLSAQTGKGATEGGLEMPDELGNGEKGLCRCAAGLFPRLFLCSTSYFPCVISLWQVPVLILSRVHNIRRGDDYP